MDEKEVALSDDDSDDASIFVKSKFVNGVGGGVSSEEFQVLILTWLLIVPFRTEWRNNSFRFEMVDYRLT